MKYFLPLFASLMVLANLAMWCCTQPAPPAAAPTVASKGNPADTCSVDAIDSQTAANEKNLWASKRTALIGLIGRNSPADTAFLPKSFRLKKCDVLGMVRALTDTTAYRNDSVWASLAIRNNQVTLIFHDYDLKQRKQVYYDFSRPCPPGTCE